ncbi:hypothetical protein AAUI01_04990 [Pseudomonas mosselii]|uniref:hypothetical protein n=1 Tax=Pseudomonas mosselii TaxID=78327 RepID=UPI0032E44F33
MTITPEQASLNLPIDVQRALGRIPQAAANLLLVDLYQLRHMSPETDYVTGIEAGLSVGGCMGAVASAHAREEVTAEEYDLLMDYIQANGPSKFAGK